MIFKCELMRKSIGIIFSKQHCRVHSTFIHETGSNYAAIHIECRIILYELSVHMLLVLADQRLQYLSQYFFSPLKFLTIFFCSPSILCVWRRVQKKKSKSKIHNQKRVYLLLFCHYCYGCLLLAGQDQIVYRIYTYIHVWFVCCFFFVLFWFWMQFQLIMSIATAASHCVLITRTQS